MKKVELTVTEKGAKIKSNRWKTGDVVKVSDGIAKQLIEKGFCIEGSIEVKTLHDFDDNDEIEVTFIKKHESHKKGDTEILIGSEAKILIEKGFAKKS